MAISANARSVRTSPIPPMRAGASSQGALIALSLSMLLSALGTSIVNVALPAFVETFAAPFQSVQWIVLAYLLASMSAIGTALGPSLGGLVLAQFGWRALFVINAPLGLLTLLMALCALPTSQSRSADAPRAPFDSIGTIVLAITLGFYALAMTLGRGHFGVVNLALLFASACALGAFISVEARAPAPLIRLAMLSEKELSAGLFASTIVAAVMMTTLIVGPFYLSRSLSLSAAAIGLTMSAGPLVAALAGAPSGRIVDRFGAPRMSIAGLIGLLAGAFLLAIAPAWFGLLGYLAAIAVLTASYALFQAANTTQMLTHAKADERGLVSGLLNLSRNLGLVTGASVMGAIFALSSGAPDLTHLPPATVGAGMAKTFFVAAALVAPALAAALLARPGAAKR